MGILKRSTSRALLAGLAILAVSGFGAFTRPAIAAAPEWTANEDDLLLLDLHAGAYRVGSEPLRGYQTPDGVCVDFADLIQTLDLPVRLDKKSRRATGWLFAEDQTFTLDREAGSVQTMNDRANLADEVRDTPEGWCVDTAALGRWFGGSFTPDLANSVLRLTSAQKLPFLEAIERKSRAARLRPVKSFDLASLPRAETPYRMLRAPSLDVVLDFGLRRDGGSAVRRESRAEIYASGELGMASFDARFATSLSGKGDSLRVRGYRTDPDGGLLGPLKATHVAVGDVAGFASPLTAQTSVGRGAIITNRPVGRADRLATTALRGSLPAGWDAELYRNGQLLAFQAGRADGRYEFLDVELLYGLNNLEVVLYGPQGQLRRERAQIPLGMDSIPKGQTHYWAGLVDQGRDLVDFGRSFADPNVGWRWGVGVERGIDERTRIGAALNSLVLDRTRYSYAELTLGRALGPMLLEASGAIERGGARAVRAEAVGRIGPIYFSGHSFWAGKGFVSELTRHDEAEEHGLRLDGELPLGKLRLPLQLAARRARTHQGQKVTEILTRAGLAMQRLAFTAELAQLKRDTPKTFGPHLDNDRTSLGLLLNAGIGRFHLRGESRFGLVGRRGFESASLVAETPLTTRSDLRAAFEYQAENGRAQGTLGYVHQFKRLAARADGRIGNRGLLGLGLSLSFSLGRDAANGGIALTHEKLAANGQAVVSVFRDENGDGLRQVGEAAIEGVGIAAGVGADAPVTNASGQTLVTGLQPFKPMVVGVDLGTLPDTLLRPVSQGVVVVPRPGVATTVMLGLAPTGEAEGTLVNASGDPVEGVDLQLVSANGAPLMMTRSDYDGYFLFAEVPYGNYRVIVVGESNPIASFALDRTKPVAKLGRTQWQAPERLAQR